MLTACSLPRCNVSPTRMASLHHRILKSVGRVVLRLPEGVDRVLSRAEGGGKNGGMDVLHGALQRRCRFSRTASGATVWCVIILGKIWKGLAMLAILAKELGSRMGIHRRRRTLPTISHHPVPFHPLISSATSSKARPSQHELPHKSHGPSPPSPPLRPRSSYHLILLLPRHRAARRHTRQHNPLQLSHRRPLQCPLPRLPQPSHEQKLYNVPPKLHQHRPGF